MRPNAKVAVAAIVALLVGVIGTLAVSVMNPFGKAGRSAMPLTSESAEGFTLETFQMEAPSDGIAITSKAGLPALTLGKEWNEPWTFVTTVGPDPSGIGMMPQNFLGRSLWYN